MSQFAPSSLRVPEGFEHLLEGLTREILRQQPPDIIKFAADYFKKKLIQREEGGSDQNTNLPVSINNEPATTEERGTDEILKSPSETDPMGSEGEDDLEVTSPPPDVNTTSSPPPDANTASPPPPDANTASPLHDTSAIPDADVVSPPEINTSSSPNASPPPDTNVTSPPPDTSTISLPPNISSPAPDTNTESPLPENNTVSPLPVSPPPDLSTKSPPPDPSSASPPPDTSTASPPPDSDIADIDLKDPELRKAASAIQSKFRNHLAKKKKKPLEQEGLDVEESEASDSSDQLGASSTPSTVDEKEHA